MATKLLMRRCATRLLRRGGRDEVFDLIVENPTRLELRADAEYLSADQKSDLTQESISFCFGQFEVTGEDELGGLGAVNDEQLTGLVELCVGPVETQRLAEAGREFIAGRRHENVPDLRFTSALPSKLEGEHTWMLSNLVAARDHCY